MRRKEREVTTSDGCNFLKGDYVEKACGANEADDEQRVIALTATKKHLHYFRVFRDFREQSNTRYKCLTEITEFKMQQSSQN